MIGLETRADFVNRIANSDDVRPFLRSDGAPLDFAPVWQAWPAFEEVIILSNGEDAVAAFERTAPGIFQSHTMYSSTCRGRRAINTAKEMVAWMFAHGAHILWGSTPRDNKKARWFNRQIGAIELPTSDATDVIFEIRHDRWAPCT